MRKLRFTKSVASGNDFIIIDATLKNYSKLAQFLCRRKVSIGADGLLVLGRSGKADFKMRIFNADGSEAEMCGNGLRCAALYKGLSKNMKIETRAGLYEAGIKGKNRVKVKMECPTSLESDVPIKVNNRSIRVNYIDTGVPHTVIFVQAIDGIDVDSIGRNVRYYKRFKPRGTNVDFVEIIDDKNIKMRTYERGVEGETLACGTGAVAAAIIASRESRITDHKINVEARGGILKVYFKKIGGIIKDVYLEGEAREVYKGEVIYV